MKYFRILLRVSVFYCVPQYYFMLTSYPELTPVDKNWTVELGERASIAKLTDSVDSGATLRNHLIRYFETAEVGKC